MINNVAVLCVWAPDVPQAAHFYKDILGLEMLAGHGHDDRPHFKVGSAYLTILKGRPQTARDMEPERFPIFALRADDLDAAVERLEQHGVEMPWGIEGHENNRWVMFYDPAGNLLELT